MCCLPLTCPGCLGTAPLAPLSPSSGLHRGPTHRLIKSPDGQSVSLGEIEAMRVGLEARRLLHQHHLGFWIKSHGNHLQE